MPKITFEREQRVVEIKPGQTLLQAADQAGIDLFRGMWPGLHCNRMKGWCNRCKVWVTPETPQAINPPTAKERSPLRLNGRVHGSLRLACQVQAQGDVVVHTRVGGPEVAGNTDWPDTDEPTKWKERWEKRHEGKGGAAEPDEEAEAEG
ncbi:MAG TPA: 2Fe-2S iron-sulfur cluster binding domain-containing protein [Polyangia bacterium]|jgi:ferredoxin